MKVVMVEPNKPAYVTRIGRDYEPLPNSYGASIMFSAVIAPEASQLRELFVWLLYVVSFTT